MVDSTTAERYAKLGVRHLNLLLPRPPGSYFWRRLSGERLGFPTKLLHAALAARIGRGRRQGAMTGSAEWPHIRRILRLLAGSGISSAVLVNLLIGLAIAFVLLGKLARGPPRGPCTVAR